MIREHGPASSVARLCLLTINAFMKEDGSAFPSQLCIAKAACLGEKTVQKHVAAAITTGWLCAQFRGSKGQAWKNYLYRSSIPDKFQYSEIMLGAKVSRQTAAFIERVGPLYKGGRPKIEGPPFDGKKVPSAKSEGPPFDGKKVPSQEGTKDLSEGSRKDQLKGDAEASAAALRRIRARIRPLVQHHTKESP